MSPAKILLDGQATLEERFAQIDVNLLRRLGETRSPYLKFMVTEQFQRELPWTLSSVLRPLPTAVQGRNARFETVEASHEPYP